MTFEEAKRAIAAGTLDLHVQFVPADDELPGNFEVRLAFNGSQDRSAAARDRVRQLINRYREQWVEREANALGIQGAMWERFSVGMENVASRKQMGGFLLGLLLPTLFVVMVAIGCFYPAVDSIAGERERNT